jgi:hypothetical protein
VQKTALYLWQPSYATHSRGPANRCLCYQEPSLPRHANPNRWMGLQQPIQGLHSYPIYCPVIRATHKLSFANGNDTTSHSLGHRHSLVVQPIDQVNMDNPFHYTKNDRVGLHMYQLQDHIKGT